MEALRQHVQHEAPDELAGRQRHGLVAVGPCDPIILEGERHAGGVGFDQPFVGDRHPVCVAREVGQDLLGSGEGALGVDVSVGPVERLKPGLERARAGELGVRTEELQAAGLVRGLQHRQHLAAEQLREHRHRQQVVP